ncbi:Xeroderma pigmentosum G I-region, partial [Halocaridina rubra]
IDTDLVFLILTIMGVKGLWKLIESSGVPVPVETLEHKILAVDVSIWLHQAVRGFRGPGGAAVANAHLLTLFHRICKLLFYRIRPVFVFDGGVPHLKKQTLASRRLRREVAASKAKQVRERLLTNLLKSQAVRRALGKGGPAPGQFHVVRQRKIEKDIFELPPLPEEGKVLLKSEDSDEEDKKSVFKNYRLPNLHSFEFESKDFKALPLETQHDILSELQDTRKENSWDALNAMPQDSSCFAEFQMGRLMKRRKFQSTLDDVREEIRKQKAVEMETEMFGELEKHVSLTQPIASEDAAHSIFIKKIKESSNEVEKDEKEVKQEEKGKSPLKKRKREEFERDFLSELEKQGIFRSKNISDSESDSELEDDYYLFGETSSKSNKQETLNFDGQALLNVVNNLLENDGLSQDEILALIKQGNTGDVDVKNDANDGPSTSGGAPGFVFNPDAESSDDDSDFIEVSEPSSPLLVEKNEENDSTNEKSVDNVKKVLETKNSSLWIKIMQQKLDDIVHTSNIKKSPKKALVDSRSISTSKKGNAQKSNTSEAAKSVAISLDLDVKPLRMEDDIFADVFLESDMNRKPSKLIPKEGKLGTKMNIKPEAVKSETRSPGIPKELLPSVSSAPRINSSSKSLLVSNKPLIECEKLPLPITNNIQPSDQSRNDSSFKLEFKSDETRQLYDTKQASRVHSDTELMSSSDDSDVEDKEGIRKKEPSLLVSVSRNRDLEDREIQMVRKESHLRGSVTKDFTSLAPSHVIVDDINDEAAVDDVKMMSSSGESENGDEVLDEVAKSDKKINTSSFKDNENMGNAKALGPVAKSEETIKSRNNNFAEKKFESEACKKDEMIQNAKDGVNALHEKQQQKVSEFQGERSFAKKSEETIESLEKPIDYSEDELKKLEGELASEQQTLVAQAQKVDRISANLNDQMYGETQDLLQLFGIPFLVAPMEAEAQCGYLNAINLTAGTITDDSDIFLFGGTRVYKNFFNQTKHVEFYKMENVTANLGVDRDKMITLALLTGSDYTEGIESVGAVSAMEVLTEFRGEGIECLRAFKKWWNVAHKNVTAVYLSKVRQKMSKVLLPESFPSEQVYQAYLEPEVDESKEKFSWAVPNVDALRQFTMDKFGWNRAKADDVLLPVMKKLGVKSSQMRIDSFFNNIKLVKNTKIQSKRMLDAIAKAKGEEPPSSCSEASVHKKSGTPLVKRNVRKRRKIEESGESFDEDESLEIIVEAGESSASPKKPSRTLLIDPSEGKNASDYQSDKAPPKARRKRKKKEEKPDNLQSEGVQSNKKRKGKPSSGPGRTLRDANDSVASPPRKLTKEIMFESLLKKQTISQRENDKQLMDEKKRAAANLLKRTGGKGKKKR